MPKSKSKHPFVAGEVAYGSYESNNLRDEVIKLRDEMLGETPISDFFAVTLLSHVIAWMGEAIKRLELE